MQTVRYACVLAFGLFLSNCTTYRPQTKPDTDNPKIKQPAVADWQKHILGSDAYFRLGSRIVDDSGAEDIQKICSETLIGTIFTSNEKLVLSSFMDGATQKTELPLFIVSATNKSSDTNPCLTSGGTHELTPWLLLPKPPQGPVHLHYHAVYSESGTLDIRPLANALTSATSFFTSGGSAMVVALTKLGSDDRIKSIQDEINQSFSGNWDKDESWIDVGIGDYAVSQPSANGLVLKMIPINKVTQSEGVPLQIGIVEVILEERQSLITDTDSERKLPIYPDATHILQSRGVVDPTKYTNIDSYLNKGDVTNANFTNDLLRVVDANGLEAACAKLDDFALDAGLSVYDALAVKWAAVSLHVPGWSATPALYDDKVCFSDTQRALMTQMNLNFPNPSASGAAVAAAKSGTNL